MAYFCLQHGYTNSHRCPTCARNARLTLVIALAGLAGLTCIFLVGCTATGNKGLDLSKANDQRSEQSTQTQQSAGDNSTITNMTMQLTGQGTAWSIAGLTAAGWIRAGVNRRRARLATDRVIHAVEVEGNSGVKQRVRLSGRWGDRTEEFIRKRIKAMTP